MSLHGWLLTGYVGVWVSKECVERRVRAPVLSVSNRENTCVSPSRRLLGPFMVETLLSDTTPGRAGAAHIGGGMEMRKSSQKTFVYGSPKEDTSRKFSMQMMCCF